MSKKAENISFEQAITELEQIVKELETNQIGLEEGITKFENGIKLYKHCRDFLDSAEKKISKINETLSKNE